MRTTGTAAARVALAGNPSDGHGGAVLALTVPTLTATVTASAGRPRPDEPALLLAARARFAARPLDGDVEDDGPPPALTLQTSIPREVGLAGSSAIVVAAMRALAAWEKAAVEPLDLARLALEAETVELGLAAGPQDRVVQAVGGLVHMDFAGDWTATSLDEALLPPLYLAWLSRSAAPSDRWHSALARRTDVGPVMARLAGHAHAARDALLAGDHAAFGAAVDASYDARTALGPLDPAHVALVETARACGASANFAGSGGAIVGVPPADGPAALTRRLRALGCAVLLRDAAGWALAEPFQVTDGESMSAASRGGAPATLAGATHAVSPS